MPSNYPTSLDDFVNPAAGSTLANPPHHTQHGDLNDAVEAIEAELGLTPSGASATVRARVDAIELARGTSFPAQPAYGNNRPFYRTDFGMWFYYDGTRWLSETVFETTMEAYNIPNLSSMAGSTGQACRSPVPIQGAWTDTYLAAHEVLFYVDGGTALGASHKWVGTFEKLDSSGAATTIATITIASGASSAFRKDTQALNALLGTSSFLLQSSWTKTGTPGDLFIWESFTYRMIAT